MDYRIRAALTIIKTEFPASPDLRGLAAAANLSVSHFQHLFKKEVGLSLKQYFNGLKLEKAKFLLENTNMQIKEIASAVNYSDYSHFISDFKRTFGLYPKKYRVIFHSSIPVNASK